jgi:hypothetical protein
MIKRNLETAKRQTFWEHDKWGLPENRRRLAYIILVGLLAGSEEGRGEVAKRVMRRQQKGVAVRRRWGSEEGCGGRSRGGAVYGRQRRGRNVVVPRLKSPRDIIALQTELEDVIDMANSELFETKMYLTPCLHILTSASRFCHLLLVQTLFVSPCRKTKESSPRPRPA